MPQGSRHNIVPGLRRTGRQVCCVRFRPVPAHVYRQFLLAGASLTFRLQNGTNDASHMPAKAIGIAGIEGTLGQ